MQSATNASCVDRTHVYDQEHLPLENTADHEARDLSKVMHKDLDQRARIRSPVTVLSGDAASPDAQL